MTHGAAHTDKRGAPWRRPLASCARLLLAALIVVAQQAALAHFLIHTHGDHHATAERVSPDPAPQANPLCDLHTVLDGMFGLPSRRTDTLLPEAPRSAPAHASAVAVVAWHALPPGATGPPLL